MSLDSSDLLFRASFVEGVVTGVNDESSISSLLVVLFVGTVGSDWFSNGGVEDG